MANGNNQGFIHSLQRVRRWICGEPDNEPLIKRHCAAAESLNSLYKRELIDLRGPWKGLADVTKATMEWVEWYNAKRIHSYCRNVPPLAYEESFYQAQAPAA